ncbi:MAG: hypothetical protein JSU81_02470 [Candidatus Coatesbacteria bacterium]|nr:MAG: hypothetical protein JSU81_02470 [Candidatus Coatesbacteria bacterium]
MKPAFTFVTVATLAAGVCACHATSWWTKYENYPTEGDINAVALHDAENGWAVGEWGNILRLQEGGWSLFKTWPTQALYGVAFGGPAFGMTVGYRGAACYFDGTRWFAANIPTTQNMFAVAVPPGQNSVAWAVGANGNVWRWSGAWSRWNSGTTYNLRDVHFTGPTEGWLCGDAGRVYYFNGTWVPVNAPTAADFYCIHGLSAADVWVGGTNGTLYHYDGAAWARVHTPTGETIRDLSFLRATAGWAACDGGTILQYKYGQWNKESTNPPTRENFNGICMASVGKGWAVGGGGTIYEYRRFPEVSPTSLGRVKALFK